jgi:transposase
MSDHRFREYNPDQLLLLPQDMRSWLPEDHLAWFVSDVVDRLDGRAIVDEYLHLAGGRPGFHPSMMLKLLIYAYCVGIPSSRGIERKTHEDIAFRVLATGYHPDHTAIAKFRARHLAVLSDLFVQVLMLAKQMGLVKLGYVALDGTKVKANASKHKAMSYDRMSRRLDELRAEVDELLKRAQATDDLEDKKYGKGVRGDEIPKELRFKQGRIAKIEEAKAALEKQARQEAIESGKLDDDGNPPGKGGGSSKSLPGTPKPKQQRNFTDPESRIMRDGATKSFEQAYNVQTAVDCDSQIIVSADVTQDVGDKQQLVPMVEQIEGNLGEIPDRVLGDSGYFSTGNVEYVDGNFMEPFICRGQTQHSDKPEPAPRGRIPNDMSIVDRMSRKLKTKTGKKIYSKRKESVEAVFGQIKQARGFRQFLLRGLENVKAEWRLICLGHNLLKMWRSGRNLPAVA